MFSKVTEEDRNVIEKKIPNNKSCSFVFGKTSHKLNRSFSLLNSCGNWLFILIQEIETIITKDMQVFLFTE